LRGAHETATSRRRRAAAPFRSAWCSRPIVPEPVC
jgi:hypothetical protein